MQLLRSLTVLVLVYVLCIPNTYATQISYSKTFVDGEVLTASDLETMKSDITTVVNAGGGPVGLTNAQTVSGNKTLSGTTDVTGILTLSNGVVSGGSWAVLEGATADDFEMTLKVTDPTEDNDITFPAATGNLVVFENANTQDVNVIFEGTTSDDFETTVTVTDPTADRTLTIPDEDVDLTGNITSSSDAAIKGWAKFVGTGTPAITDSFNFDSGVGDNATGDYTLTFTTDFATNEAYAVAGMCSGEDGTGGFVWISVNTGKTVDEMLTGTIDIETNNDAGTGTDYEVVTLIVIGDQ